MQKVEVYTKDPKVVKEEINIEIKAGWRVVSMTHDRVYNALYVLYEKKEARD